MPWAQKLVEAEGLSVVSLIGGHWGFWAAAGPEYSWDGDSPMSGLSLGSGGISPPVLQLFHPSKPSSKGVQCCFPLTKRVFFSNLPFLGE